MFPEDFSRLSGGRIHKDAPYLFVLINALKFIGPDAALEALEVKDNPELFRASWPWSVLWTEFQNCSIYGREPLWLEVVAICTVALANYNSNDNHRHFEWRKYGTSVWTFIERLEDGSEIHCVVDGPDIFPTEEQWKRALEVHQLWL